MEVRDTFYPANTGTYGLDVGPDGAQCSRTNRDAGLVLDVAVICKSGCGLTRVGQVLHDAGAVWESCGHQLRFATLDLASGLSLGPGVLDTGRPSEPEYWMITWGSFAEGLRLGRASEY